MTKTIVQLLADNNVTLDPGDIIEVAENTGTTPLSGAAKLSQLMFNRYKVTPTVVSNDLVLALKHEDNTDPSADRPLYFKIGNSLRACTAALSVTKADATNWAALGSAELATKETDLFAYLVWNTNLAPDAVDIFWSRIPYGRLYSDFSATTTAEKYAAINATAPAATDECINIGRFAATLSAGAGYTFTVPTYTNLNLVHHPIFETRLLSWTPVWTNLTISNGSQTGEYMRVGNVIYVAVGLTWGSTTSIAGAVDHSLPCAARTYPLAAPRPSIGLINAIDTGSSVQYACIASAVSTTSIRVKAQTASGTYLVLSDISSTVPFTWANTDTFHEKLIYET